MPHHPDGMIHHNPAHQQQYFVDEDDNDPENWDNAAVYPPYYANRHTYQGENHIPYTENARFDQ